MQTAKTSPKSQIKSYFSNKKQKKWQEQFSNQEMLLPPKTWSKSINKTCFSTASSPSDCGILLIILKKGFGIIFLSHLFQLKINFFLVE